LDFCINLATVAFDGSEEPPNDSAKTPPILTTFRLVNSFAAKAFDGARQAFRGLDLAFIEGGYPPNACLPEVSCSQSSVDAAQLTNRTNQ
jgi:hypothetical protein